MRCRSGSVRDPGSGIRREGFSEDVDILVECEGYGAGAREKRLLRLIRPGVRLEMGIRGGTLPGTQRRTITSHIADYLVAAGIDADYQELNPVQVDVIAPVRTLAEKLAASLL